MLKANLAREAPSPCISGIAKPIGTRTTQMSTSKLNCILLVDDDEATNEFHEFLLVELDIVKHIQQCIDGKDALNYLTNQGKYANKGNGYPCPELIFLDINMPGMNGFEFLEAYHNLPPDQKGNLIIIMLTTSLLEEDRKRAASYSEVTEFRNKPLTREYVLEVIEKYCNNAQ